MISKRTPAAFTKKMLFFPECSTDIRGATRLVASTPRPIAGTLRLVVGAFRCSQVHPEFAPVLQGVPTLISITPMVLLYLSSEIPVTPKASQNALLGSDTLLKLTHLSLHSTSSETLLEALSDWNTFRWCSICHLVNDTLEYLCHSAQCNYLAWYKDWIKCRIPLRWSLMDPQTVATHWIQSLQQMPLPFFTNNPGIVALCHIHPFFKGISPQNWLWQPHNNLLTQQFAYPSCCHRGKSPAKTYFICHQRSWLIWIPNPSPHIELYCPNLVCQKRDFSQDWNWTVVASDLVCFQLPNRSGIQRPDCLIKALGFKFVVEFIGNIIQYTTAIILIEDLLTILHLLLNLPCIFVSFLSIRHDHFQLLQCKPGR